jgi:phospholipase/carboxylesterase
VRRLDDLLEERGISWSETIIGGFSQGAVMAYAVGLGRGRPSPAGLLAFSGFIPDVAGWEPDLEGREGLKVVLHHAENDPIIGVEFGRDAAGRLRSAGIEVEYLETAAGHALPAAAVDAGRGLVAAVGSRPGNRR